MLRTCEYCVGRGEKVFGHYDRTDQKYFGHCAKKSVNDRKKNQALLALEALKRAQAQAIPLGLTVVCTIQRPQPGSMVRSRGWYKTL